MFGPVLPVRIPKEQPWYASTTRIPSSRLEPVSLWRSAVQATPHCLTGCAIGEVLGMVLATAFGWGNAASIGVSVLLAFVFGYALTIGPMLRAGVGFRRAVGVAVASDTVSITTMEIVDNAFILMSPARWPPASATLSSGGASASAS
jgi:hypothetical protein